MPIARSSLAELEAAIARAEIRLARRHLALVLRAAAGLDTTRAEAKLRRARGLPPCGSDGLCPFSVGGHGPGATARG